MNDEGLDMKSTCLCPSVYLFDSGPFGSFANRFPVGGRLQN